VSRYVVLRLLDSFFRHKLLHLLPIIAFAALGVWYVATQEVEYQAKGVLLVEDETLLTTLTEVGNDGNGFQAPAERVSTEVNALLQTEAVLTTIAEQAGLGTALTTEQLRQLRESIGAFAVGENLLHVWSNDVDADTARAKAAATIDSFIEFQIDSAVGAGAAAQGVLDPLTEQYRRDVAAAQQALADYLRANPVRNEGLRPADQQVQVDQLTTALTEANTRYTDALEKDESARLATAQAEDAVRDRFQVVDRPQVPTSPLGRLRTRALALAVFLVVGGILSAASVVLGAVLDQSVRYPLDVTTRLGVRVLGVIPDTSAWRRPPAREDHADHRARRRVVA
jgi:uncharacterized protein involved in exopolysaccharide biosynthesis